MTFIHENTVERVFEVHFQEINNKMVGKSLKKIYFKFLGILIYNFFLKQLL